MTREKLITISVVIPVYNDPVHLRGCLTALQQSTVTPDDIIVVDDASTDITPHVAAECGVRLIRLRKNSGPSRARNIGARKAKTNLLFFIDADVRVHPDTLAKIHDYFLTHPQVSAVIGSYDAHPLEPDFLSQFKNLSHHFIHQTSKREAMTFWGACGVIRRDVFCKTGGFSEAYSRPCIEDIEFGYRLKQAGYCIHLLRHLQVTHAKKWTFFKLLKTEIFDRAIPWTRLMLRQKNMQNDLNMSMDQRLSGILAVSAVLCLAAAVFLPVLGWIGLVFALGIIPLNRRYYRYFLKKRGWSFVLLLFPMHVFYYLYSVTGFTIGFITMVVRLK